MTKNSLDDWIVSLAAAPADRSLDALETEIGRAIAARRGEARTVKALAPMRVASIGLALLMGVTAGSAAAMAAIRLPGPGGPLAAGTQLAPSTLLDSAR
jgi:hypothetical protein